MKKNKIILFTILLVTIFMSIGYATINLITLDINSDVVINSTKELFIESASILEANDDSNLNSKIITYSKTMLKSEIKLLNSDSYVTISVTLYNNTSKNYKYDSVTYDDNEANYTNKNIKYEVLNINKDDIIKSKESITVNIKFSYDDVNNIDNNTLISYLKFNFNRDATYMENLLLNKYAPNNNPEEVIDISNLTETERKEMFNDVEKENGEIYKTKGITNEDIYFLRGVIDDNYVKFAGYLWRILQIDENGNLKLILDNVLSNKSVYNTTTDADTIDIAKNILDYQNSSAKNYLDNWATYFNSYSDKIVETKFCTNFKYVESVNPAINNDVAYFQSYINVGTYLDNHDPNLVCPEEYIIRANTGLIMAEEVVLAGGSFEKENTNYFLYNSNLASATDNGYFWTLSPAFYDFNRKNAGVFMVTYKGKLVDWYQNLLKNEFSLKPVITISGDIEMNGDGSISNPYKYEDNTVNATKVDITSYDDLENNSFIIANTDGKYSVKGALSDIPIGIGLLGIETANFTSDNAMLTSISAIPLTFTNKTLIDGTTDKYKYQIKNNENKYLKINSDKSIEFTNEETYLKVTINNDSDYSGKILISTLDDSVYLNFYGAASKPLDGKFAGWNTLDANAYMRLYKIEK